MEKIKLKALMLSATILSSTALAMPALASQDDVLNKALVAESQKYWQAAEEFYKQVIQNDPDRADLWERLADIIAEQGRPLEAAEALARAADLEPGNATLQAEAAAAFGAADQPEKGLLYINRAIALDPGKAQLLSNRSVYEGWLGDYPAAEASLQTAYDLGLEHTEENLLRFATLKQWQDKLVEGTQVLEELLGLNPNSPDYILFLARLYAWRGDYAKSTGLMDRFAEAGGDAVVYAREKALMLAWADMPKASLATSDPVMAGNPDDAGLLISRAIAHHRAREYDEAFALLDRLDELTGPSREVVETRRILGASVRSNVEVDFRASTDRDNIDIIGGQAVATYALKPGTYLRIGVEGYSLDAPVGSGLDRIDGVGDIFKSGLWAEIEAPLGKGVWGSIRGGVAKTDFQDQKIFAGGVNLHIRGSDKTTVNIGFERDFFLTSPRALSLGIVRNEGSVEIVHRPNLKWYTAIKFTYADLNDNNQQKRGDLTLIRQAMRRTNYNLDVGFTATWYGYDLDLPNGYYDPSFYQRYLVPVFVYYKFNNDDGLSITIAPGVQKDNTMDNFQPAFAGSIELTLGLYRDWMLQTTLQGYYGGAGAILAVGDYWVASGRIRIVKRF